MIGLVVCVLVFMCLGCVFFFNTVFVFACFRFVLGILCELMP